MFSTHSVDEAKFRSHSGQWRDALAWIVTRPDLPSLMRSTSAYFEGCPSARVLISLALNFVYVCDLGGVELTAPHSCRGK